MAPMLLHARSYVLPGVVLPQADTRGDQKSGGHPVIGGKALAYVPPSLCIEAAAGLRIGPTRA